MNKYHSACVPPNFKTDYVKRIGLFGMEVYVLDSLPHDTIAFLGANDSISFMKINVEQIELEMKENDYA